MLRFKDKDLEYVAVPGVVGPITTKSKNQALIVSNNFGRGDELPPYNETEFISSVEKNADIESSIYYYL